MFWPDFKNIRHNNHKYTLDIQSKNKQIQKNAK